ncbi:polysaccharide pyruvyl transferase family protein [Paenibacillus pini]|uniref:Polysaccharide pyruvyl transferase domain-containing protein n=1 Tax=Paenibacillus pini JCM 16418 TaxID=1236976 RepID=W7YE05_9BACL|nr:polysaccharide pyruvyl transferase family protein [Paenibacillus pini]GAF06717.1 hypothetical protein JCM16418_691 [Paenibacillus pini JCM 16418]
MDNYPEETWPPDQVEKYRSYISKAKSASFRDQRSADIASKAGFHAKVRKVQDIVFAYSEKHFPIKRFSNRPTIGICVFSYPSYPFENMVKLSMHLIQKGYHIVFIPVINHPSNIYSDFKTCENMTKSIKEISPAASVQTLPLLMDLDLTYNYIQSMDFLISYKLHPALVALRAGKPVFALSQMSKVSSLLASFGMDKYMCNYQLPYEEIQAKVDTFLKESTQVIQKYEPAIRSAEKESLKQILALKKEIESRKFVK